LKNQKIEDFEEIAHKSILESKPKDKKEFVKGGRKLKPAKKIPSKKF
jgi:hypothetical protein